MSEVSKPEFSLVVSNIEAQNVGYNLGDQRHDKQLVQIELKGKQKQCTDTAIPCDSADGEDGCRLFTKWENQFLTFDLDKKKLEGKDKIRIKVFQYGIIRDKLLGKADLSLEGLVCCDEKKKTFELNLYDGHNRPTESIFKCEVKYSVPEEQRSAQQDAANNNMASQAKDDKSSDIETGAQHPIRKREYPNKALDFQVQVKVIEARQLEGGHNINPVITIAIDKVKKHTRVQDTTNRPYYNQTFAFNFPSTTFADLFDKYIQFEVLDSGRFRSDALIGFYKCDVRDIYELEGHILLRKWIMLAEPEENEMIIEGSDVIEKYLQASGVGGAPAGFVQVSMAVLEAGVSASSLEDSGGDTADDDIESNLLKLPGVTLTPAMFKLRIYKAEDLPQMDPKNFLDRKSKDWVDPYCVFSFAGKKATSKIKYDEKNPDFNQQLNVPFHFPSMCDKLKIQLMDWDRLSADDPIGAVFLSLPSISGDGTTGFLPTFGPCYVNFYGSPREFCNLPSELDDLNEGIGEGVAYRGRVLVELETKLYPERSNETQPINGINKVQAYRARKQFHLLATFLEATMLAVEDSSVQFEVSIGNYGNKLDDSVSPSPSSTAPMNPVFDGHRYYYIPWGNTKPYVSIDCEWEDITFRLGTLNKLLNICATLENNMEEIKKAGSGAKYDDDIIRTLDQLIDDCSSLPELDEKNYKLTALDLQLRERRLTLLTSIATEAEELARKLDNSKSLQTIERFLKRIQDIAVEPQNSMPDVIIWMLKGGTQRVAYCRIPAYKLLYTPEEEQRGVHCGKIIDINLKYPGDEDGTKNSTFPALLRVMLWFGLKQHDIQWDEWKKTGGELSVYAETYENQSFWVNGWSSTSWKRPPFSNADGTRSLPKDDFVAPDGWQFVSKEWEIRPELSIHYDNDSGCSTFLEDAFENETRLFPGGKWRSKDATVWTDIVGEVLLNEEDQPIKSLDDIKLPQGWQWSEKDKWKIDDERAVDNYGWEYTVETSFGSTNYDSSEKMYHFCRRRRWTRERKKISGIQAHVSKDIEPNKEGWEYAVSFGTKFHTKKKGFDMVRRRRLHKKLVMTDHNAAEPIFRFEKDEKSVLIPPSIFLYFKEPHICQFRAYLYQGRNVLPADSDGLADPYVHMSFGTRSATSKTIMKKLSPTWDQMLVLESVPIYGHYDQVIENPPDVLLEIFDKDPVGKDDLLGRVQSEPIVIIPGAKPATDTNLSWIKIYKDSCHCGDVLAAFELYMDESVSAPPLPSPDKNGWYPIPPSVRPVMQKTAVEILCWGLRNLSRFRWASVKSPSIEVEIGDTIQKTSVIKNLKANPNFETKRLLYFNVDLPRDHIYTPPITIRLRSNSSYGHPIIGVCVVDNLRKFERNENQFALVKKRNMSRKKTTVYVSGSDSIVQVASGVKALLESTVDDDEIEEPFDWWSKYEASKKGFVEDKVKANKRDYPANYDRIQIYPHSLEEEFDYFQDFLKTFHLRRGKVESPSEHDDEDSIVGEFKGNLSIYSLPEDPDEPLPPKMFVEQHLLHGIEPVRCLVRVYIIKAYDLSPSDQNGLADPYLIVSLGTQKFNDQKNYEAGTLDVQFGKVFEFNAEIPLVKDLKIKVMDYDRFSKDDLIGETTVDLESRLLSRLHATTGLPTTYSKSGINKWRLGAGYTPSVILKNCCDAHGADDPVYQNGNSEVVLKSDKSSKVFSIKDFDDDTTNRNLNESKAERLSLHVLNSFKDDLKLVPEHVETRDLVNSLYPTFPQGKLEMFVDIFPEANGYPGPPMNIAPRTPKKYELRVIVWNTKDVLLQETNLLGEEMSDIYVKCKLNGVSDVQKSDVHYRSLNGEGMFNWRMLFPFEYSEADEKLIVMKKANFLSMRKFQEKRVPELNVEVWDNDLISRDDFIGSVRLNLQDMPSPYSSAKEIKDWKLREETRSLFEKRSVKGWWPVEGKRPKKKKKKKDNSSNDTEDGHGPALTGKVEMTLELLESKDAEARPVGKGQDKPNQHPVLEKPKRPATSFLWITNPWKSFRFIFWRRYKWYIIGLIILILLVLLVALFLYAAPGYSVKKLFKT